MKHDTRAHFVSIGIAIFLCFAAGTMIGCRSKESRFEQHLERAEAYSAEQKYAEAALELRNALSLEPSNPDVNWRLAELMRKQGKQADELFYYSETSRLDPSRTDAILMEASLLYGDDPVRARALIDGVLERDPQNAEAHLRASELALVQEDLDEALAQAMTAAELDPKKGLYQQQIGVVYRVEIRSLRFQERREPDPEVFERAVAALRRANEIDGPRWEYEAELARVYRGWFGHGQDAENAYRRAVEVAIAANDPAAAAAVASEVQGYASGTRNGELGKWVSQRLTEVQPEQIGAWLQLATFEEATGGDAEAVYRRMLEQNPKALAAHVSYARWLVTKQRGKEAIEHLSQAKDAGLEEVEVLGAIANLQFMLGSLDEARATIERMARDFPENPRTRLSEVQLAIAQGRLRDAVNVLRDSEALQQNPEALRMLAFSQMALGQLPAAADAIGRAVALSPGFDPGLVRLQAQIQHQQRDFAGALVSYQKLSDAGVPLGRLEELRWIQAIYETGDAEAGRARLDAALEADDAIPEDALEFAYREGEKHPARARKVLEDASKRNPDDPRLVHYLAQLDVREGQTDRALARLGEAAASPQASPLILFSRAKILASEKDWTGAEADLNRLLATTPAFPGAADLLVQVYEAQGKIEEAIRKLEDVPGGTAAKPESDYLLGRLYSASGASEKALAHYERAISAAPQNAEVKNDLAFLLAKTGQDLNRALTLAQEAQQMLPQNPAVVDTLGYVYLRKGLNDPAREQLSHAIQLAEATGTARPEYHAHLAEAYRASGRLEDANTQVRKALDLDPNNPEALAVEKELRSSQAATPRAPGSP